MKRRILCIACLVFFILSACTLLSLKIEKEMLIQVETKQIRGEDSWGGPVILPKTVLFEDDYGSHLYQVVQGSGWENGLRVDEVSKDLYKIDFDNKTVNVLGGFDYCFITTASRQPVPGELVEIIEAKDTGIVSDSFIFVCSAKINKDNTLSRDFKVIDQSENAIFAMQENASDTFFEHKEKGMHHAINDSSWRIISANAVSSFWKQLPYCMVLAMLILCVILLWIFAFILSAHTSSPQRLFVVNGIISICALIAIHAILTYIDLPSAMLPPTNILHIRHYLNEYEIMLSGINTLPTAIQEFSIIKTSVQKSCFNTTIITVLLTCLVATCEWLLGANMLVKAKKKC